MSLGMILPITLHIICLNSVLLISHKHVIEIITGIDSLTMTITNLWKSPSQAGNLAIYPKSSFVDKRDFEQPYENNLMFYKYPLFTL